MEIEPLRKPNLPTNTPEQVRFREVVQRAQQRMQAGIESGKYVDAAPQCTLRHYFTPVDPKYGCCAYAREIFLPKGSVVIGKIHRHQHLNFITKGRVSVLTEFGEKHFEAPCTFVSEVGLKRVVLVHEDTTWTTVHLTQYNGEDHLAEVEDEVIAPTYQELGLIDSTEKVKELEHHDMDR